ncbi:MAG: DUF3316 domain-containing protein [Duncaniella sp.]|uniref:DUF3316 domain-containing protein n=1 Tax=Duncaniella sp. TaxID=2518496 RepID=UPI0023BC0BB7|nr:DUF3316 domain-containing protein [Duncaniella sp.]MDE5989482.1 DUF3316 domain-containing protein [Duncaniella sp.]
MIRKPILSAIVLALSAVQGLGAQTPAEADTAATVLRPVFAAYTAEWGAAKLTDTYLTPLRYEGWHAGLDYQRYQAMKFDPQAWTMRLHFNLSIDKTDSPARNASMWDIMLSADWGMMRKFRPVGGLTLAAGGSTGIELGCLYNPRNGNNPASAKAAWTVNLTGFASYPTRILRLPVTFTYQPTLPVTGVFFSPDYGELYYEIWLGDRSGLAHWAWWGNYFKLDNQLSADLHFGATNLRVGYHGSIFSSKVNHLVTNRFTHALTVGISGEWISVNPRRGLPAKTVMINALY